MPQDRGGAARLRSALRYTLRVLARQGTIDGIGATLLAAVRERSFPVCTMLAWSKAPYPQILRISLSEVRSGSVIAVRASDGSVERYLAGRPMGGEREWAQVDTTMGWMTCDEEDLRQDIAQARRECRVELPPRLRDETEIFRHLWASVAFWDGLSREEIGRQLGRPSASGASAFIHPIQAFFP